MKAFYNQLAIRLISLGRGAGDLRDAVSSIEVDDERCERECDAR